MALDILQIFQIIGAVLLMFFLPGFMLVQALFPRKNELDEEHDLLFRVVLGIGMSIVITALDGFVLGSLGVNPVTDKGFWDPFYITLSLSLITIVLFFIGWYRGSYPSLKKSKKRPESTLQVIDENRENYLKIMNQLKQKRKMIEKLIIKLENAPPEERKRYEGRKSRLEKKVKKLEDELIELGKAEITTENDEYN
jgi:uncharacterized membrane protein